MEYRGLRFCMFLLAILGSACVALGGTILVYMFTGVFSTKPGGVYQLLYGITLSAVPAILGVLLITVAEVIELLIRLERNTRKS